MFLFTCFYYCVTESSWSRSYKHTHSLSISVWISRCRFFLPSPFHFNFVCRVSNNSTHFFSGFSIQFGVPFFLSFLFIFFSFCCFRLSFGSYFWYIMIATEFVAFIFSILMIFDLRYPTWYHMRSSVWNRPHEIFYIKSSAWDLLQELQQKILNHKETSRIWLKRISNFVHKLVLCFKKRNVC